MLFQSQDSYEDDEHADTRKWVQHSRQARYKLNIEPTASPWSSGKKLSGIRNRAGRQADLLDIAYATERKKFKKHSVAPSVVVQGLLADISQSVARKPWGRHLPTLMQRTLVYSFDKDVVLSGFDHLRLQGRMVVGCCSIGVYRGPLGAVSFDSIKCC